METAYKIPEINFGRFAKIVDGLARKAAKLGQEAPTYSTFGSELVQYTDPETGDNFYVRVYNVSVTGIAPIIEGWQFVAVLQHEAAGNIINALPGFSVPSKFRQTGAVCEHCNINRQRNDTFVVHNIETGEYKQVGSTCLKDFTGHVDPHAAARYAEALALSSSSLEDCEDLDFNGNRGPSYFSPVTFLGYVVWAADKFGFVTKTKAGLVGATSTASVATSEMFSKYDRATVTDEQSNFAKAAWEWAREYFSRDENKESDYGFSLYVVTQKDGIEYKDFGRVAYVVEAYRKHLEEQARIANSTSNFVGKIGDRVTFTGTVLVIKITSSNWQYTTRLIKFQTAEGNVFTWFSSNEPNFKVGDVVTAKGTIKDHSEYKGEKSTLVARCKVQEA